MSSRYCGDGVAYTNKGGWTEEAEQTITDGATGMGYDHQVKSGILEIFPQISVFQHISWFLVLNPRDSFEV